MLNKNKKAQLGETLTWIVATLIIIVLLSISIFVTNILANAKSLSSVSTSSDSAFSFGYERTSDVVMENSLFAEFQIENSIIKNKVHKDLINESEEGKFTKNFDSKFTQIKFNLNKYDKE